MSKYQERDQRGRRGKIGFYAAFAICLIAICMAVYSTYNTVINPTGAKLGTAPTVAQAVNEPVTGVLQDITVPTISYFTPTEEETEEPTPAEAEETPETTPQTTVADVTYSDDALQTMLAADISLGDPVKGGAVCRPYSKDSVYFKNLNVWKPHLGTDFKASLGDDVYAMTGGEVTKVSEDKLLGKTVEISVNNAVCIYSGLADCKVKQGDRVDRGETIATVGAVPFEADDETHIHVAVKINGSYADPLNFIGNEE